MAKKRSKKKQSNFFKIHHSEFILLILFALFLILGKSANSHPMQFKTNHLRVQSVLGISIDSSASATLSAKLATPTPTLKPTPQPYIAPQDYGHSIHLPILYYHYIGNNPNPADTARDSLSITPDRFNEEMVYLSKNGFNTVTYPEIYAALKGQGSLPSKSVMLTFDDGYIDFYLNAFPVLQQYHLKSVAFIPSGRVDTGFYLHWDQIKQMNSTGLVDFEAHSVDHLNLVSLSQDELVFQLSSSKQKLEQELGRPVNFMAYPYGASDPRVWEAAKNAGYLSAMGTWFSSTQSEGQIFDLPRIRMGGAVSLSEFIQKIQ